MTSDRTDAGAPVAAKPVASALSAPRWPFRRADVWFLLIWLVVQGLGNVVVLWLLPAEAVPSVPPHLARLFEAKTLRQTDSRGDSRITPYRLMTPNAEGRFPLLVFLHGAGQRGTDNVRQLGSLPVQMANDEWRQRFPCFLLAPQCPERSQWSDPAQMDAVLAVIEETVRKHPSIDRSRIYLTGLSMGGFGSWSLSVRIPDVFAAVAPICGGGDPARAAEIAKVPIWAFHGDADDVVPVERSRRMIEAIRSAGGSPRYTELPGIRHDSWTAAYRDSDGVLPWMFAQARSRPVSIEEIARGVGRQ